MKPVRLQRQRTKGFKLTSPNGLPIVYVGRPSRWGNPFEVGGNVTPEMAVQRFAIHLHDYFGWIEEETEKVFYPLPVKSTEFEEWLKPLKGKNLACWCYLATLYCHARLLLSLANNIPLDEIK